VIERNDFKSSSISTSALNLKPLASACGNALRTGPGLSARQLGPMSLDPVKMFVNDARAANLRAAHLRTLA
jgi:hypothetical protein